MNKMGVFYLGQGYDFKAVTAVVLGGMIQSGGQGSVRGVLGGVLVIGLLGNILTLLGINYFQAEYHNRHHLHLRNRPADRNGKN